MLRNFCRNLLLERGAWGAVEGSGEGRRGGCPLEPHCERVWQCVGADRQRFAELIAKHHYLKSDKLVGEQLRYVAEIDGRWLALLSWSAAANHLKDREEWIGWNSSQRRRRLALVANNARYLILPGVDCPNLASRVLALCCERLAGDWQQACGHPVLVAESFVDSQLFRGTCYKAQGWQLLGRTKGSGRSRQDYYTAHGRPKQLWMRELRPKARAVLRGARLPADLQHVEDAVIPRCEVATGDMRRLFALCREVPDWRARKGRDYPLPCLLSWASCAAVPWASTTTGGTNAKTTDNRPSRTSTTP